MRLGVGSKLLLSYLRGLEFQMRGEGLVKTAQPGQLHHRAKEIKHLKWVSSQCGIVLMMSVGAARVPGLTQ